jgi:hypothetical protein
MVNRAKEGARSGLCSNSISAGSARSLPCALCTANDRASWLWRLRLPPRQAPSAVRSSMVRPHLLGLLIADRVIPLGGGTRSLPASTGGACVVVLWCRRLGLEIRIERFMSRSERVDLRVPFRA